MKKICPKCGYERQQEDDKWVSSLECPKCGIVYEKYVEVKPLEHMQDEMRNDEEMPNQPDASGLHIFSSGSKGRSRILRGGMVLVLIMTLRLLGSNASDADKKHSKQPSTPIPHDQMVIFHLEQARVDYKGFPVYSVEQCKSDCISRFGLVDATDYTENWIIESSNDKTRIVPTHSIDTTCNCIGTEYILKKR